MNLRILLFFCLATFTLLFERCAPSRYVKPLAKKQSAVGFSYGGAFIKYKNAPIPLPFTTLGYAYGISNRVTGYANVHFTSALFGNSQLDLGATVSFYEKPSSFGITASPALQIAYNVRNKTGFHLWPSIDFNFYKHLKNKDSYYYAGFNSWIELSKFRAHHEIQPKHYVPNLQIGFVRVKNKWQHQFEIKYLGVGLPVYPGVVDYIGIKENGAFGIFYSVIRKF